MAEHHYIIKFDDKTKEWSHDPDSEEAKFLDGTIWDEDTGEWNYPYQGAITNPDGTLKVEGVFYRDADIYDDMLTEFVAEMNRKK